LGFPHRRSAVYYWVIYLYTFLKLEYFNTADYCILGDKLTALEIFIEKNKNNFNGVVAKKDRLFISWKGANLSLQEFCTMLKNEVVGDSKQYMSASDVSIIFSSTEKKLVEFYKQKFRDYVVQKEIPIPEELEGAQLLRLLDEETDISKARYAILNKKGFLSTLPASHFRISFEISNPEDSAKPVMPVYNPTFKKGLFQYETNAGDVVDAVNSYIPPKWVDYFEDAEPILPREVKGLFSQIDGDLDRKYFLYFLRKMIWGKNSSYLILQGSGGIGKTTMKSVFKALVGGSNFATGKNSLFKSVFNSSLENTKLMVFDEAYYTYDEEPFMKELPNPSISIEAKFKNSTRETKVFSSFILMNNKEKDNYIAYDARKFCPVRLHTRRLETVLNTEEIETITKKCGDSLNQSDYDPKYIASIAKYLYEKCDYSDLFPQGEYRGPKFWQICRTSMFAWQASIIDALENPIDYLGQAKGAEIINAIDAKQLSYSILQNKILQSFKDNKKGRSAPKFPNDYSSARHFLDIYRDLNGGIVYTTKNIPDKYSYDDFYVEVFKKEERDEDLL
jgi:hypothetical protein